MPAVTPPQPGVATEEFWRDFLLHGDPRERALRKLFSRIPAAPRCKACAVPFAGIGGRVLRLAGKRPSDKNPGLCTSCFDFMIAHRGGAEIECTMLFADIRGSTTLAEGMAPGAFRELLDRFYHAATTAVYAHDGGIDKFVGDEVVAMFFPLAAGEAHAAGAIRAADELLRATGHAAAEGPWVPVGAGVHTGQAWVGAVGDDQHVELTAVGDAVNVAARLASAAAAGEVLISIDAALSARLDIEPFPRTRLALRGRADPIEVVRLPPGHAGPRFSAPGPPPAGSR